MTDKLTPPMLRDLARLHESAPLEIRFGDFLRAEAARREAEAKPHMCDALEPRQPCLRKPQCPAAVCLGYGPFEAAEIPREGPGSTAAPKDGVFGWQAQLVMGPRAAPEDKPAPAVDDLVLDLRFKPGVSGYWPEEARFLIGQLCKERDKAADRIEAQAQKLEVQAMEIVEQTNARLSTEARVRELEAVLGPDANANTDVVRILRAEKARADRLAAALGLVLPLAKGYVAVNGGGGNREYIAIAESALASEAGDRG